MKPEEAIERAEFRALTFNETRASLLEHTLRQTLSCWPHLNSCEIRRPSFFRSQEGRFGPCDCDRSGAFNAAMDLLRQMDAAR